MSRVHNFSAGPAALPAVVLERARDELLDWNGTGASVMEVSHRSPEFVALAERAELDLRELLKISDDYAVLFLQGGATQAFAQVPMNIAASRQSVDYVVTGAWGKKAVAEAEKLCEAQVIASSHADGYTDIADVAPAQVREGAAYVHYTPNETIHGVEYHAVPDVGHTPLVADASSTILSRPLDVHAHGIVYAGAQKNIGPAGLTLVIVRRDLLDRSPANLPLMLSYRAQADKGSMLNTPPTFAWYLAGLVFQWLKDQGGLDAMAQINERKATTLYDAIDGSDFYANPVAARARSWMNVPFTLADPALDSAFLAEADEAGLTTLKGHRSVGGMRASLYNAVPQAAVDALVSFMGDFERRRG